MTVILWETEEHREAAGAVREPASARQRGPLRTTPGATSKTRARGTVTYLAIPRG